MDETTHELFGGFADELFLPRFQSNRPEVLPAGAVLGQQAWPMLRIKRDLGAVVGATQRRRPLTRHQGVDGLAALLDDSGVFGVENDP